MGRLGGYGGNMVIIKWTNKYSNETGFVKQLRQKDRCFENTYEGAEARKYSSQSVARGVVKKLISYGEGENNNFEIISC